MYITITDRGTPNLRNGYENNYVAVHDLYNNELVNQASLIFLERWNNTD